MKIERDKDKIKGNKQMKKEYQVIFYPLNIIVEAENEEEAEELAREEIDGGEIIHELNKVKVAEQSEYNKTKTKTND